MEDVPWSTAQSLWSLIREHVSESELPKIHTALGHSLVDRYTEAYAEMEMWQRMLEDAQLGVCSHTGAPLSGPGGHRAPLADPPAVKQLVRAEVGMLLQTLSERAGRNGETHLSRYKPETVSYALGHNDTCPIQLSGLSDSRSVSRLSTQSHSEVEIEEVKEKLNVDGIEQVVGRLKSLFIEECEALKKEIKQLQRNIWMKSQQKLWEPAEPTLGDLKELREAIQKDLTHYPVPYTSSLKSTHRSLSVPSHRPQVFTPPSLRRDGAESNPPPFNQPKPPTGPPPGRTSTKPTAFSTPSKSPITTEPSKTTPPKRTLTSPSRPSSSPMTRRDGDSSPENRYRRGTTPTDSSSFALESPKNSPVHKTHSTSHDKESNLSPQMEKSLGQGSRKENVTASATSPRSYERNNGDKSGICSGEEATASNGLQNVTPGCNLLTPTYDRTKKSSDTASNKCQMGLAQGLDQGTAATGSGRCKEAVAVLYAKGHASSSSPKTVLKQERTETEYLNRFIQPVPPPRLK